MTEAATRVHADTYVDSVLLMAATRAMSGAPGVEWAAAAMGTPANVEDLAAAGFDVPGVRANDLVLVVAQDVDLIEIGLRGVGDGIHAAPGTCGYNDNLVRQ